MVHKLSFCSNADLQIPNQRKNGYLYAIKNIVFDLGGVLFARDKNKSTQEFHEFFSFIRSERMPLFWEEYDRGTLTFDEVLDELSRSKGCDRAVAEDYLREALDRQEAVPQTAALIRDLKRAGYRLYVLSNMSREFIDFLRRTEIYGCFDGEVVSCEEGVVKPEPRIYEILLDRFGLDPAETLFIDDRRSNLEAAAAFGIATFHFREPESSCTQLREMLLQKE